MQFQNPNPAQVFNLKCPVVTCDTSVVDLLVHSLTVATFGCPACQFQWSVRISELPSVQRQRFEVFPAVY